MNSKSRHFNIRAPRWRRMIGTGGIGTGLFFEMEGDHTLGRNESRPGRILPVRDYCKLHIIAHYMATLLGPAFPVTAIGAVGADDRGRQLLAEMQAAGIRTDGGVRTIEGASTLFSFCFQYPDKSGGNMTTSDSASSRLTPGDIDAALASAPPGPDTVVLAAPEVPLPARLRLLQRGRERGAFNVASCVTDEIPAFMNGGGIELTDLLALNIDEAAGVIGVSAEEVGHTEIGDRCYDFCRRRRREILLSITRGADGANGFANGARADVPCLPATPVATGGAGDAFLSGVLVGLWAGLPFLPPRGLRAGFTDAPLDSALDLGTALASMSVTSGDTIHHGIEAASLRAHIAASGARLAPALAALLPS